LKFNNQRQGKYRSLLEARVAKSIPKKPGIKVEYEKVSVPYVIEGQYLPDFVVTLGRQTSFIIEAKGFFRVEDKRKMVAVRKANPHLDIRFVFSSSSKRNKRWCEKYGFGYAVGTPPKEWFSLNE
jgi:hypothetical protein